MRWRVRAFSAVQDESIEKKAIGGPGTTSGIQQNICLGNDLPGQNCSGLMERKHDAEAASPMQTTILWDWLLVKPLRIGKLGDFVRIEADSPQLLGRERGIVRRLSGGY